MNLRRKQSSDLFQADSSLEVGVAGGLAFFAVACFVSESMQIIILGTLVAFVAGAAVARSLEARRERRELDDVLRMLPIPFALATEPHFFGEYVKIADALTKIVKHSDLLFQDLARGRIENVATDLATLAGGEVVFDDRVESPHAAG